MSHSGTLIIRHQNKIPSCSINEMFSAKKLLLSLKDMTEFQLIICALLVQLQSHYDYSSSNQIHFIQSC